MKTQVPAKKTEGEVKGRSHSPMSCYEPHDIVSNPSTATNLEESVLHASTYNFANVPTQQCRSTDRLPLSLKAGIENLSGIAMGDIRVHYNSSKPAQLNASAYTQGKDIYVASRQESQLPHEAWHIVQQKQGRVNSTVQMQGEKINDDVRLEEEADVMGSMAERSSITQQSRSSLRKVTERRGVVQRTIHKGTTKRSKKIEKLKATGWFKDLLTDDHRAWAQALHKSSQFYTKETALQKINEHIQNGDPVPVFDSNPKAERLKRVRDYVNANSPQETDLVFKQGSILAEASSRAYNRHRKKYIKGKRFNKDVNTINKTAPGLFDDQKKLFKPKHGSWTEWQQIVSVTHSKPQSFELNLGGDRIAIDSMDVFGKEKRSKKRKQEEVNLNQLFIDQRGKKNSYWKMSDSNDRTLADEPAHKKLRHLEVEREPLSALTTYLKDELLNRRQMTTQEAFGDEVLYTFQEYKGALNPSRSEAMKRMQFSSAYNVLQYALKNANAALGTQVGMLPVTTSQKISDALDLFESNKTEENYKKLVKEIYRLIRTKTEVALSSDSESDSDTDYP